MNATTEPSRLLVAGDVHGNVGWFRRLCDLAARHNCEALLQLGDFGFWPHDPDGLRFLKHVSHHAARVGVDVYWIDGNHENHTALAALDPGVDGFVEVADCCLYVPRGHRWSWRGVRFGALGGAFSIDWRDRTPGKSWWPEEVTTIDDVDALGASALDVLVAHDAPAGVPPSRASDFRQKMRPGPTRSADSSARRPKPPDRSSSCTGIGTGATPTSWHGLWSRTGSSPGARCRSKVSRRMSRVTSRRRGCSSWIPFGSPGARRIAPTTCDHDQCRGRE